LNLNDHLPAWFRRCRDGFLNRSSRGATRDFESISGKNRFALIFVESRHGFVLFRMKTPNVQPACEQGYGAASAQLQEY
jgi:hypothetical protein